MVEEKLLIEEVFYFSVEEMKESNVGEEIVL